MSQDCKELVTEFQREFKERYGNTYYPNQKDWFTAKYLIKEYGILMAKQMVITFYDAVRDDPQYRNAPISLSCLTYNRNDMVVRTLNNLGKKENNPHDATF